MEKVNSYDALNRLSGVSLKNASNSEVIGTSYSYIGMLPSSEISSFTELYYTYDAANRITRIAEYGDDVACYTYDAQGQLIREDNAAANKTWIYTYDNYGNILTRSTYDFSTDDLEFLGSPSSVKTWSYTSSSLGKQLSHVDYDAIGNPVFDYERSWSYTWNGRLLTEIMGDGGSPIFQAKYNEDGIRTHKAYSEDGSEFTYHDYILEGSLILQEHAYSFYSPDPWEDPVTQYTNYYYYDENGSLVGLNYNGTNYYYYKNILGDILGIVNSSGELVVEYTYDAWGNILSTTGSMASTLGQANPFRYRSYYYDAETGFYYLNSRYYDPSACRFINADSVMAGVGGNPLGYNVYSYCFNDPVNFSDSYGNWPQWVKDSIKSFSKDIVKPATTWLKNVLSNVDRTYTAGVNIGASPGIFCFSGQLGLSIDAKGSVELQGSLYGGFTSGGSPGVSITEFQTCTNAPRVENLRGMGYQMGGAFGFGDYLSYLLVGADLVLVPADDGSVYSGMSTNIGFGPPSGEGHIIWGKTEPLGLQFNLFDLADKLFSWIEEW